MLIKLIKRILPVLLLVALVALLLTRCAGGDDAEPLSLPTDGQAQGEAKKPVPVKEQKLGTVTATENGGIQIETEEGVYSFSDVSAEDWCVEAVNFAVTNGLMSGMDDGSGTLRFSPDHGMSRAQLAKILFSFTGDEPVQSVRSFDDVKEDDWYYESVNWAVAKGYITPTETDSFGVEEFCSCEEVLTILHRVAGSPSSAMSLEDYPYAAKISEQALTAMRWAWEKGLIAEDECVWYPTQAVSRAQIALLLMRYDAMT